MPNNHTITEAEKPKHEWDVRIAHAIAAIVDERPNDTILKHLQTLVRHIANLERIHTGILQALNQTNGE